MPAGCLAGGPRVAGCSLTEERRRRSRVHTLLKSSPHALREEIEHSASNINGVSKNFAALAKNFWMLISYLSSEATPVGDGSCQTKWKKELASPPFDACERSRHRGMQSSQGRNTTPNRRQSMNAQRDCGSSGCSARPQRLRSNPSRGLPRSPANDRNRAV